jgi:sodium-dependent phosphate transporter
VYTTGKLQKNVDPPIWQIVICAGALVVGLATYGYNVTRAMGVRLAKLSPVRGFAAELATSLVIMVASQVGLSGLMMMMMMMARPADGAPS